MKKLREYLKGMKRDAQERFAITCGTTIGYLRKSMSVGQLLGPDICVAIERESGRRVTRLDLRPHDWHRFWPELMGTPDSPHVPTTEETAAQSRNPCPTGDAIR